MFTGILITNIISIVAGIGCTMIDSIVTGQFLGTDAITASGMITPVVMIINLVGGLIGGALTLVLCIGIPFKCNKKLPRRLEDFLILKEDFGAGPDECFETSMKNMDDVMETSEQVMKFCSDKGADRRTAFMFSLFVEEMAANIVNHGFGKGSGGSIDLRLIYRDDSKVIRMRDDSLPFDPVSWLEKNSTADPSRGMGIRMVVKLAKSVTHMNSMEMNNLIIQI